MIHKSAMWARPLALCLATTITLGCANVRKATTMAHFDPTDRADRKRELVEDYEHRRNDVQFQAALSQGSLISVVAAAQRVK